jgi:uncharacterized protein
MTDLAPVQEQSRIKSLDVVRGWALLGILAVNAIFFAAPFQTAQNPLLEPVALTDETTWSWYFMHVFFEFKMITLFSMLFGVSIFLVGGERSDKDRGKVLHRRLAWLALFGLLHGALLWYGDILLHYALCGFIVMLARSLSARTLFITGAAIFTLITALGGAFTAMMQMAPPEALEPMRAQMWSPPAAEIQETIAAYQAGALSSLQANFEVWYEFVWFMIFFMPRTIGLMMVGMGLYKWGFFSGAAKASTYWVVALIGAVALALVAWQAQINAARDFDFLHMMSAGNFANTALSPFISLLYASLLILLVKAGAVRFFTNALAAVGRMAFTNYLMQTIIMTTIFYGGRGFGLFGEVDRVGLWGIVVAVWAAQLIWSPLWLSRFSMGPFEWVWRSLSYARPVSMAKASVA